LKAGITTESFASLIVISCVSSSTAPMTLLAAGASSLTNLVFKSYPSDRKLATLHPPCGAYAIGEDTLKLAPTASISDYQTGEIRSKSNDYNLILTRKKPNYPATQ